MMDGDIFTALRPVLDFLERKRLPHYIGGSLASSSWGRPRSTNDADVVVQMDETHVAELLQEFSGDYYVSQSAANAAVRNHSCFNLVHFATSLKVDIFVMKDRDFDRVSMQRVVRRMLGHGSDEFEACIASAEDVVLNKIMWYDKGNRVSERQWLDIVSVLKVRFEHLDFEYLRKWATDLKVAELLQDAFKDAGVE